MNSYFRFFSILFISFSYAFSFAQSGSISGTVKDKSNGSGLESAKVMLMGVNKMALTNDKGEFSFPNVEAGTYMLEVRFMGYVSLKKENILVEKGQNTSIEIEMENTTKTEKDVKVTWKLKPKGDSEITKMQINQGGLVDGINKSTFTKTPDARVSDVFKRISGASVQDNKFVVVRGLSDRYNFALINGASLPSTESDRKAFAFDIFPSNMLENLFVMKSATPELPGEFAGGVIDIKTLEPRDEAFQNIQIGGGYNTISTFKNFKTYTSSNSDIFGLGSSSRGLPDGLPTTADFNALNNTQKAEYAKLIPNSWGSMNRMALPNFSLQYSIGNMFELKDKQKFGYVFAYSYANNFQFNHVTRREFEEQASGVVTKNELRDSAYTQSVLNTGMLNLKYQMNANNDIQLKTLYSISADDKVNIRNGKRDMDIESMYNEKSTNIWYTQNNILTSQLIGNHTIKKNLKVSWNTGISDISRQIPFLRRTVYQQVDTTLPYFAVIQNNDITTLGAGNMFWSNLDERIYSARYDLSYHFGKEDSKNFIKAGGMQQYRTRSFSARNLGFSKYDPAGSSSFESTLLLLPEDQIFSSEHLGQMASGQGGFKLEEGTNVDDSYQASSMLHTGYAMIDTRLFSKLRVVTGARLESYNQQFHYVEFGSNLQKDLDTTVLDILPSINLTYSFTKKFQFRASASRTLSRPEFRELAPFTFYNFLNDNLTAGDPKLQRALINNYDARLEYFPGDGQVISVSGFYKDFQNPIELILRTGTSGTPELYYRNVGAVKSYGAEIEYRMKLDFLSKDTNSFWKNFTFYTNASLIQSKVDLSDVIGQSEYPNSTRPMQGQSPFIINAGIFYANDKDLNVSMSYNLVGQRIAIAGSIQEPSVWENGRNVIDFQISKTFNEKYEVKLNVKDALAQDLVFFQDINKNQKYDKGVDSAWQEITFGQSISLSLKYKF
ncbi:MAG: TonB-dependent receptor domain-containing protein [Crocinitomicaceae bacterium]